MTLIAPLDLQTLFVNLFAGNMLVFIGLALLAIATMSARFRMPNVIFGMILALFGILMVSWAPWLYVIVVIIGGLLVGYSFTRIVKN